MGLYGVEWCGMVWECLQKLRRGWMLSSMWTSLTTTCCLAWQNQELMKKTSFSNRIMIPSIHPEEPENGLKNTIFISLTGQHNPLMLMSLNISGEYSRRGFQPMNILLKEYGSYGESHSGVGKDYSRGLSEVD